MYVFFRSLPVEWGRVMGVVGTGEDNGGLGRVMGVNATGVATAYRSIVF